MESGGGGGGWIALLSCRWWLCQQRGFDVSAFEGHRVTGPLTVLSAGHGCGGMVWCGVR